MDVYSPKKPAMLVKFSVCFVIVVEAGVRFPSE